MEENKEKNMEKSEEKGMDKKDLYISMDSCLISQVITNNNTAACYFRLHGYDDRSNKTPEVKISEKTPSIRTVISLEYLEEFLKQIKAVKKYLKDIDDLDLKPYILLETREDSPVKFVVRFVSDDRHSKNPDAFVKFWLAPRDNTADEEMVKL